VSTPALKITRRKRLRTIRGSWEASVSVFGPTPGSEVFAGRIRGGGSKSYTRFLSRYNQLTLWTLSTSRWGIIIFRDANPDDNDLRRDEAGS
jgi:hypothetical protein